MPSRSTPPLRSLLRLRLLLGSIHQFIGPLKHVFAPIIGLLILSAKLHILFLQLGELIAQPKGLFILVLIDVFLNIFGQLPYLVAMLMTFFVVSYHLVDLYSGLVDVLP